MDIEKIYDFNTENFIRIGDLVKIKCSKTIKVGWSQIKRHEDRVGKIVGFDIVNHNQYYKVYIQFKEREYGYIHLNHCEVVSNTLGYILGEE